MRLIHTLGSLKKKKKEREILKSRTYRHLLILFCYIHAGKESKRSASR